MADSEPDLSPEIALVRQALSSSEFHDWVVLIDHLFALMLAASRRDLEAWDEISVKHGATPMRPIDMPLEWEAEAVSALLDGERAAWLAKAVHELAHAYYGYRILGPFVAGNDTSAPGGLLRALLLMVDRSEDSLSSSQDSLPEEPPS